MTTWVPIDVMTPKPYQVVLESGASALLASFVDDVARVAVVYPARLADVAARVTADVAAHVTWIEVPDAEAAKTPAILARCWETLAGAGFTRSDAIVGLGGGTVTDLAGFVAATWLRGVRFVAMPTTVVGMVDAAVGGKTGINLPQGKNLVGAFWEPYAVIGDLDLLGTLDGREIRSGLAEVLKAGFIADPWILDTFEGDPQGCLAPGEPMAALMRRAVAVKAAVVAGDLTERTSQGADVGREALNYGHTLAHAIERCEDFRWRHGEAVSVGMVFAAEVAHRLGLIDAGLLARHRAILASAGLPTHYDHTPWADLRAAMSLDKKTRGTHSRLLLLNGLGSVEVVEDVDEELLADAYASLSA